MNKKRLGVMIDCSRNAVSSISSLKRLFSLLKGMGYSYVNLYTEDTFEVKGEPYFGYQRGRYTIAELQELDSYCNALGLELMPCIQTLAHINQITRYQSYNDVIDVNDILLVGEEKTYELIEKMFISCAEAFTSRNINIGMDEAHMLGLGKYLDKFGYQTRYEIMTKHLKRVQEIARKYGFSCRMWSDMFFRLISGGEYYVDDISNIPKEMIEGIPEDITLIYWDYYSTDYEKYNRNLNNHQTLSKNIAFAGGAWKWVGFAPLNQYSIETMKKSIAACNDNGIMDYLVTCWGDNGGECGVYSVLPALFDASQRFLTGAVDYKKFRDMTGVSFEDFMLLDLPNNVGNCELNRNSSCKFLLYDDLFYSSFNNYINIDMCNKYGEFSKALAKVCGGEYGYLFEYMRALCDVLELKTKCSIEVYEAYNKKDVKTIAKLAKLIDKQLVPRVKTFSLALETYWSIENKSFGVEIQQHRLGGLSYRLSCQAAKLQGYANGKIECIEELEERLPCGYTDDDNIDNLYYNNYGNTISPGTV